MRLTLVLHILAGGLGLLSGYAALAAVKGGTLDRRAGRVFVYAMLTMCAAGFTVPVVRSVALEINIPAALLAAYLVVTALTVRPPGDGARWLHLGGLAVALAVGLTMLDFAAEAVANGGKRNGMRRSRSSCSPSWGCSGARATFA